VGQITNGQGKHQGKDVDAVISETVVALLTVSNEVTSLDTPSSVLKLIGVEVVATVDAVLTQETLGQAEHEPGKLVQTSPGLQLQTGKIIGHITHVPTVTDVPLLESDPDDAVSVVLDKDSEEVSTVSTLETITVMLVGSAVALDGHEVGIDVLVSELDELPSELEDSNV